MSIVYLPGHPLRSAWLKVARAEAMLHDLYLRISAFEALEPKRPVIYEGPTKDGQRFQFRVGQPPQQPDDAWGVLVGDFTTNLQGALDNIAWALTSRHGQISPAFTEAHRKRIHFPQFTRPKDWATWPQKTFINPAAHATLERFQPYHRTDWPELDWLATLDKLANLNKHRIVTPVLAYTSIRLPNGGRFTPFEAFDDADRIYEVPAATADEVKKYLKPGLPVEVA
ncbi:MAG TPA: hypothetical protein VIB47_09195, partial [Dehalococcoidia bacterium]